MLTLIILLAVCNLFLAGASPLNRNNAIFDANNKQEEQPPTVIWHGLGDTYDNPAVQDLVEQLRKKFGQDHYVYMVRLDQDPDTDRRSTFFGNAHDQVESIHSEISKIPQLRNGFNALGFSQGGIFLRSMAQSYSDPPIFNLITMGSPHMGVSSLPPCDPPTFFCKSMHWLLRSGVWTHQAQNSVIPAQYFRDQSKISNYLKKSGWLKDVNNERWFDEQIGGSEDYLDGPDSEEGDTTPRNESFKTNLSKLNSFVMFKFTDDDLVIPYTSPYFTLPDPKTELPIPYSKLPLYNQDYIGIKILDERGALKFDQCKGRHMQVDQDCFSKVINWLSYNNIKNDRKSHSLGLVLQT